MDSKDIQPFIIIVCIAALLTGAGGWWYNKEYFVPAQKQIQSLKKELARVTVDRQAWQEALRKGRGKDAIYELRFNYFTKQDIPTPEIQPTLLHELTTFFEEHTLDFVDLRQQEIVVDNHLQRIPFTLSGFGRFRDIVALVRWLEEEKSAVLTDITMTIPEGEKQEKTTLVTAAFNRGEDTESTALISFQMSWHWVEGVPRNFISVVSPPQIKDLVIPRDPFHAYTVKTVHPEPDAVEEVYYQPAPAGLHLSGIMKINGTYKALINDIYLEAGMNYKHYHVMEINEDELILGKDNIRYQVRLKRDRY